MLGKIPAARLALIEKIAAHATRSAPARRALAAGFVRHFFRGVSEDDLRMHAAADLAAAALAHLEFGRVRKASQALVELAPALDGDAAGAAHRALVRVVSPDMPFLVDSIGIVFSSMNIAVHLIVHPVLRVRRDARGRLLALADDERAGVAESWQMMEIDRPADETQARELLRRLHGALDDVRKAVADFRPMLERVRALANELERSPLPVPRSHAAEARALLSWMHDGHFVFLGYRHYHLKRGRSRDVLVRDPDSGLGILRGSARGRTPAPIVLTGHLRNKAREPDLLVLTKANTPSTVHRASYLDYVGIKTFDAAGSVNGEHRFLGLWTSSAYHSSPAEIPLLRRKLDAVIQHFDLPPQSHDAKAVVNVIENFPRDELFQMSTAELIASVRGIVNLYERRRVRLFARRDAYERFYSCLVYVPRDRYNTEVRERIERIVRQRFGGTRRGIPGADLGLEPRAPAPAGAHAAGRARGRRRRRRGGRNCGGGGHLGRPLAAGADLARCGARCRGARESSRADVSAGLSRRGRTGPGARRHRRSRGAGSRSRRSATQSACACRCAGQSRAPAHPALGRPDSDLGHSPHARELRAARAGRTQLFHFNTTW